MKTLPKLYIVAMCGFASIAQVYGQTCATVGGCENTATGDYSTIGGGKYNKAPYPYSTIGGGFNNLAYNDYAAVGGGIYNYASGTNSTIGGGANNSAKGNYSTISGGYWNTATGKYATVAGGTDCKANGAYSFAAGRQAMAEHRGAFVWNDSEQTWLKSTADNQFLVRASGGTRFYSNAGATLGVQLAANATAWSVLSDRNTKEDIKPINTHDVLEKLQALPLSTWSYKADPDHRRYMGPMAQDFHAAFGLGGDDDKHISTIDTDGVTLAAIQALSRQNQQLEQRIAELEKMITTK